MLSFNKSVTCALDNSKYIQYTFSIDVTNYFLLLFQIFDKEGQFKFSFGVPGKDEGQLFYPRKIAVLRDSGYYVICDRGSERSRMQIFSPMGHFIRRIPIRFIDIVAGLAISREGTFLNNSEKKI